MKIVLVNSVYGVGSTGKILKSLKESFTKEGNDVFVCYSTKSSIKEKNIKKITYSVERKITRFFSKIFGLQNSLMYFSTLRFKRLIKRINPDIINFHMITESMFNFKILFRFLKRHNYKCCFTMHSDVLASGNCAWILDCPNYTGNCSLCLNKRKYSLIGFNAEKRNFERIKKCFSLLDTSNVGLCFVSSFTKNMYQKSGIYTKFNKQIVIFNPVDIYTTTIGYKKNYILYVTPNFYEPQKQSNLIFEIAKNMSEYKFVVVCPQKVPNDFKNINFVNSIKPDELNNFYSEANLTLILSKRESFSMCAAESLMNGTPVVGFENGGTETISIKEFSYFVKPNDVKSLISRLKTVFSQKYDSACIKNEAIKYYESGTIAKKYLEFYDQVIN